MLQHNRRRPTPRCKVLDSNLCQALHPRQKHRARPQMEAMAAKLSDHQLSLLASQLARRRARPSHRLQPENMWCQPQMTSRYTSTMTLGTTCQSRLAHELSPSVQQRAGTCPQPGSHDMTMWCQTGSCIIAHRRQSTPINIEWNPSSAWRKGKKDVTGLWGESCGTMPTTLWFVSMFHGTRVSPAALTPVAVLTAAPKTSMLPQGTVRQRRAAANSHCVVCASQRQTVFTWQLGRFAAVPLAPVTRPHYCLVDFPKRNKRFPNVRNSDNALTTITQRV